jgi:hypothetical protein
MVALVGYYWYLTVPEFLNSFGAMITTPGKREGKKLLLKAEEVKDC